MIKINSVSSNKKNDNNKMRLKKKEYTIISKISLIFDTLIDLHIETINFS